MEMKNENENVNVSNIVYEVINIFFFFLRENFLSIKNMKRQINNFYLDVLYERKKHETLNKQLLLTCTL